MHHGLLRLMAAFTTMSVFNGAVSFLRSAGRCATAFSTGIPSALISSFSAVGSPEKSSSVFIRALKSSTFTVKSLASIRSGFRLSHCREPSVLNVSDVKLYSSRRGHTTLPSVARV